MLRYKNSLLERILLEKGTAGSVDWATEGRLTWVLGIDVQSELKSKTEGSSVMPHHTSAGAQQPTPVQRAVMNRHNQVRRSTSGSQGSRILRAQSSHTSSNHSPRLQPTPPTTTSPSTTRSPIGLPKGGMVLPNVDLKAQHQQQQQPPPPLETRGYSQPAPSKLSIPANRPTMQNITPSTTDGSRGSELDSTTGTHTSFYPATFQAHIEQLGKLPRPLLSVFLNRALFVLD